MNKEDKKEISLRTVVKAVVTGYIAYGILVGFLVFVLGVAVNWGIKTIPNVNMNIISISVPLIGVFLLYFVIRGICKLSIYDVFKKCKTNPENLSKVYTRLNLFILIAIAVFVISSILIMIINFYNAEQDIKISSYQYQSIHSPDFANQLTNKMIDEFAEEKKHTIISTVIIELGMVISLFSAIPLQKKLISEANEF